MRETGAAETRAYVIHPDIKTAQTSRDADRALEEAVSLAHALPGLHIVGGQVARLAKPQAGTLFGSGKIDELGQMLHDAEIDLVLIDGPVTPVQQRNLEKVWKVKLLDRTGLILEIFADRARTREGVLQVDLAALSYQRTRLVRAWTHLERQRGGLGFVGGPGETQIEADRRAIDEQITRIRRQLAKVVKTRELHRAARAKVPYPIVALVGYTNAGKSTLFNRVTGAEVFAKDMLFATLDPTMRAVKLPSGEDVILSDTVGFISNLPTELVAAFRATLEEVLAADIIVHVRDISHPETREQSDDVHKILEQLGVNEETPQFEVWNKIDLLEPEEADARKTEAERREHVYMTSALDGRGMDKLLAAISDNLRSERRVEEVVLPFDAGKKRAWLYAQGVVQKETPQEDGTHFVVEWTPRQAASFAKDPS